MIEKVGEEIEIERGRVVKRIPVGFGGMSTTERSLVMTWRIDDVSCWMAGVVDEWVGW
jgi:hypothetical protein